MTCDRNRKKNYTSERLGGSEGHHGDTDIFKQDGKSMLEGN